MTNNFTIQDIPLGLIFCDNEFNVRGVIDRMKLLDFARDIADNGLQTPITVRPYSKVKGKTFQIVAGHRRYTAFDMNNFATIPAIIRSDLEDEFQAMAFNIRENIQREQLTLAQETRRVHWFMQGGMSAREVADLLGKTVGWVEPRRLLADLPKEVQDDADKGVVQQSHIAMLHKYRHDKEKFDQILLKIRESYISGNKELVVKETLTKSDLEKLRRPTSAEQHIMRQIIFDSITMGLPKGQVYLPSMVMSWVLGDVSTLKLLETIELEPDCDKLMLPPEFQKLMES